MFPFVSPERLELELLIFTVVGLIVYELVCTDSVLWG